MKHDPVPNQVPATGSAEPAVTRHEEICARAYEVYAARGREEGHDLEDWLQAEKEITSGQARKAAA